MTVTKNPANSWIYSDTVKEHFFHPKNVLFEPEESFGADARGVSGNVICGDQMLMLLKIRDDKITDIKWKTYGCASAIASTSMLSEVAKGMNIFEAYKITADYVAEKLGGLPPNKKHCSVIGDEALRAAINDYLKKTGRKPLKNPGQAGSTLKCD
jgi:nitrogen fixation NifU-like protein